jgi:hypothetical protein
MLASPGASPTERPSPEASPAASTSASTSPHLALTQTFDTSPRTTYATDVVGWRDGFVAVGSSWASEFTVENEMPALWVSHDGQTWQSHAPQLGVDSVTLVGIAERADGRLLLVGTAPGGGAQADSGPPVSVAWVSEDSVVWQPVDLPTSDNALLDGLAHGPKGYVLSARTPYVEFAPNADQTPGELWFSSDAVEWTKTYEGAVAVEAGIDGFVAIESALAGGPQRVVASADGVTWIASGLVGGAVLDVAPLGGDWLALAGEQGTIRVMRSPNGLNWEPAADVNDLTGPDGPKTGRGLNELALNTAQLTGGRDRAYLMLGNNHCCAQMGWTYGIWATTDGTTWTQASSDSAYATSQATRNGITVVAGHLGRGDDAAFWLAP